VRLRPRNIRTRLTLWYLLVLSVVLSLHAISGFGFFYLGLREEYDRRLLAAAEQVIERLQSAPHAIPRDATTLLGEHRGLAIELRGADGRLLFAASLPRGGLGPTPVSGAEPGMPETVALDGGARYRVLARRIDLAGETLALRIARNDSHLADEVREEVGTYLLGLPVALLVAGLGGYWLAGRVLRPLDAMTRRAAAITASNLSERLPVDNPHDELGNLAGVINSTLSRIDAAFQQLHRFTADASHELRTPLTTLRAVGEVALQIPRDAAGHREAIGSMLEETGRLSRLVDNLLLLSRADAESSPLARTQHRLLEFVAEATSLMEVLAEERDQRLVVSGDARLVADIDALVLRRAVVNVLDNAIKYSPAGARIDVAVRPLGSGHAAVEIRDPGKGIAPEHHARIFERFYRVETGRSRDPGGTGLGLAIARWAVQSHGGRLELESAAGQGSLFRIVLEARRQ